MRVIYLIIIFVAFCITLACNSTQSEKIVIATSANMQYAIMDIVQTFEKKNNIECEVIINSSGQLCNQILKNAPYDVFISADTLYPDIIFKSGIGITPPRTYAKGNLIILSTIMQIDSLETIFENGVKKVAIPNPQNAPYGIAAQEVLNQLKNKKNIGADIVYGNNISQVNQYINTGAVSIGFTSKSTLFYQGLNIKRSYIEIPDSMYNPIIQNAVLLNLSGESFYNFLFERESQSILKNFGYKLLD